MRCRIGQSDPHAGRTFESFAADLANVADELGIKTFFVVGVRYASGSSSALRRRQSIATDVADVASQLGPALLSCMILHSCFPCHRKKSHINCKVPPLC